MPQQGSETDTCRQNRERLRTGYRWKGKEGEYTRESLKVLFGVSSKGGLKERRDGKEKLAGGKSAETEDRARGTKEAGVGGNLYQRFRKAGSDPASGGGDVEGEEF